MHIIIIIVHFSSSVSPLQARTLALAIGQAFNVAYQQFLRNSGVEETSLHEVEYASILSAQHGPKNEIDPFLSGKTKQVVLN